MALPRVTDKGSSTLAKSKRARCTARAPSSTRMVSPYAVTVSPSAPTHPLLQVLRVLFKAAALWVCSL